MEAGRQRGLEALRLWGRWLLRLVENASHRLTYSIAHGVEQGADRVSGVSSPIGARVRAASLCTQFVFHSYIFLLD